MINNKRKILFIDITKTAGTAIIESLKKSFPKEDWEGKHHSVKNFTAVNYFKKPTCSEVTDKILYEYQTFSVVRNPFDRIVSLWLWGINGDYSKVNFGEFVRKVYKDEYSEFNKHRYRTQLDWITDNNGDVRIGNIIRYENLENEFNELTNSLGLGDVKLIKTNTAEEKLRKNRKYPDSRKSYQYYYYDDIEAKNMVEELYREDLEYFGYSF